MSLISYRRAGFITTRDLAYLMGNSRLLKMVCASSSELSSLTKYRLRFGALAPISEFCFVMLNMRDWRREKFLLMVEFLTSMSYAV